MAGNIATSTVTTLLRGTSGIQCEPAATAPALLLQLYDMENCPYCRIVREVLTELGLDHLMGSPLLRAHLHGFFMDIRLYRKAASARPANSLDTVKADMVRKQIEEQRQGRVRIETKVPKVNKDLFMKLKIDGDKMGDKKRARKGELLEDDRFGALFTDDRFEVDTSEETYRLINPVVSKLDGDKKKEFEKKYGVREGGSDDEVVNSDDDDMKESEEEEAEESSDDDQEWTKQLKKEHKNIKSEKVVEKKLNKIKKQEQKLKTISNLAAKAQQHILEEVKTGSEFSNVTEKKTKSKSKKSKLSLEDRIDDEQFDPSSMKRMETGHVMTFEPERSKQSVKQEEKEKEHRQERLAVRRSAKALRKDKIAPKFWMGKRV